MSKAVQKIAIAGQAPAVAEASALISLLERMARDPNIDPARIQQFLQMKRDDEDRLARRAFMSAFADLQGELPAVARRGAAHNGKKYARFEDIVESCRPVLLKHGFTLSYRTDQQDGALKVTGVLGHKEGHDERTSMVLPWDKTGNKNDVQAWGSSTSYGKRYVALTLLGIATEDEDDDGKKAGGAKEEPAEGISQEQANALQKLAERAGVEDVIIFEHFKVKAFSELTKKDHDATAARLKKKLGEK